MRIDGEGDTVSLPGLEAKPSPQSSAELTYEWIYTSIPQHAFIVCTGTTLPLQWRKTRCQQFIAGHKNSFGLRVSLKKTESQDVLP
jgi:hypothetical protein